MQANKLESSKIGKFAFFHFWEGIVSTALCLLLKELLTIIIFYAYMYIIIISLVLILSIN